MTMKDVDEAIAELDNLKEKDIKEIAKMVTLGMCQITGSTISYFALYDEKVKILKMIGWSMSAMMNCSMINKPIVYKLDDTGLWGDAVRERKAVITNDYKNLVKPTKKGYPQGHVNIRRHMNLPVIESGKVVLVAGVGNKSEDYTTTDSTLLTKYMNAANKLIKTKNWE